MEQGSTSASASGFAFSSGHLSLIAAASRTAAMDLSRERRRRRFLLRRGAPVPPEAPASVVGYPAAPDGIPWGTPVNGGVIAAGMVQMGVPVAQPAGRGNPVPVVGGIAVSGRMSYMEDAICIRTNLCKPPIAAFSPVHYFGVFDGHGGAHFSSTCKKRMHQVLREQLTGVSMQPYPMWPGYSMMSGPPPQMVADESALQETWKLVMRRCFARTETVAHHTCPCGSVGFRCGHRQDNVTFSGTTAVTVVLTDKHIITANCGDSRAVLYRGQRIVPLSFDHKGDRRDERVRVESSGGRIVSTDTHRVEGILAMTRAIGDRFLKPLVISEPDVTFIRRDKEDEFVILASDGFWDVVTIKMAGDVARECLSEEYEDRAPIDLNVNYRDHEHDMHMDAVGPPPGFEPAPPAAAGGGCTPSRSSMAAALLCRLAVARRSGDNVSVIVVDLKRNESGDHSDDDMS